MVFYYVTFCLTKDPLRSGAMGRGPEHAIIQINPKKADIIQQNSDYILQNEKPHLKNAHFQGRRQNLYQGCKAGVRRNRRWFGDRNEGRKVRHRHYLKKGWTSRKGFVGYWLFIISLILVRFWIDRFKT